MTHTVHRRTARASRIMPRGSFIWARRRVLLPVALGGLSAAGLTACGGQSAPAGAAQQTAAAGTRTAAVSGSARAPGSGRLTQLDGRSTTLRAFAGRRLMVWFVANGCAGCAASIPAVAHHLPAFARAKVRVLVLGIYGAFGQGAQARAQLTSFGRSAADGRFADPAWTWGLASAGLTSAYDPGGVPDEYFLLDRAGRTVYRGSVPASTMGALLRQLKETAA
jgi:hypothetical protein